MNKGTTNLTQGSILINSISLSWPMLVSYFLQVTVSLVDLKMVSVLGTEAVAAVGLSQQFIMLAFLIFSAVSVGASIYISQFTGRNDIIKIRETIVETILLSIVIGFALTILGLFSIDHLIKLMNVEHAVAKQCYDYTMITFYFAPALLLNFTMISIFRSTGDSKTPLYIMLLINVLNVILNYVLINGIWIFPKLGVSGSAFGTSLSRLAGVIICFLILYKRELFIKVEGLRTVFRFSFYAPRFAPMRRIFTLGFPTALQDISWSVAMITISKVITFLPDSTKALSAFSIAFNLEAICFMPGIAFMQAATIMVGQHFGAKQIDSAEKAGWLNTIFGSSFMAILGLPLAIFPEFLIGFFTKDTAVISIGKPYLILMGFTQLFIGIKFILMGSLNGAGDTKVPLYAEVIEHWIFRIPPIIIAVIFLNYATTAIWGIMALSNVINAVAMIFIFKNGYWKKIKLI